MPTLPTYDSKQNIRPMPSSPLRNEAGAVFESDRQVIGTMQNIAKQWSDANDVMQYTEAKANYNVGLMDIQARAEADPDFKNSDKYYKELATLKQRSTAGIQNQMVASKAGLEFDYDMQIVKIKIGSQFRQKQLVYNQQMVKTNIESLIQKKATAETEPEASQYDDQMRKLISDNIQAGTLSPDEAKNIFNDSVESSVLGNLYVDTTGKTSRAILESFKDDIDIQTYSKMRNKIDTQLKENSAALIDELNGKFIDDSLTIDDVMAVNRPIEEGGIGSAKARVFLRDLSQQQKSKVDSLTEEYDLAEQYISLVDEILMSPMDNFKAKQMLVDAYANGQQKQDLKQIKDIKEFLSREKFTKDHPNLVQIPIIRAWMGSNNDSPVNTANTFKNYLRGISEGQSPEDARESALKVAYNNTYPQAPLSKDEKVIDFSRERQLANTPILEKLGKGFGAGVAGMVKGVGGAMEMKTPWWRQPISPILAIKVNDKTIAQHIGERISAKAKEMEDFYAVPDADFAYKLSAGFGSMSTFVIPGIGVARGVQMAAVAPRMAAWLGIGASSYLESTVEAGNVYKQAIEKGMSENKAIGSATKTFWANLPLTTITNKFGLFGDAGTPLLKFIRAAGNEGLIQEGTQQIISNIALEDPILQGYLDSVVIGSIVGGGTKVAVDGLGLLDELGEVQKVQEKVVEQKVKAIDEMLEPTTEFGQKLKAYMEEKQNIPLHPAEEGKKALEKLYENFEKKVVDSMSPESRSMLSNMSPNDLKAFSEAIVDIQAKDNFVNKIDKAIQKKNILGNESGRVVLPDIELPKVQIPKTAKKFGKDVGQFSDASLVPLSTRLAKVSPKLRDVLVKFEHGTGAKTYEDIQKVLPIMEKIGSMPEGSMKEFDLALKNADKEKINEIVEKNGLQKEYADLRQTLDDIYKRAKEVGVDVKYLDEYFPRQVDDVDAFMEYLYKNENWSQIEKAIRAEEEKVGDLNEEERAEFINKLLRGYGDSQIRLTAPSNIKGRKIDIIDDELNKFYKSSPVALQNYIRSMNALIEAKKLFGLNEKDVEKSIGAYVRNLVDEGTINASQEREVKAVLDARFKSKGMHGFWSWNRNLGYIYTMGSPISAVTQIADIAFSLYENGVYSTAKGISKALSQEKITKEDIGVNPLIEEFSDASKTGEWVRKLFKTVGLEAMDSFGKETMINASFDKLNKQAISEDKELLAELDRVFEDEAPEVLNDLKQKNPTDNVKYLLFARLAKYQPIALSEMPEYYVKGGNLRVAYMLKSYVLKQLDVYHNEVLMQFKDNPKKALGNLIRLSMALAFLGASTDAIKDVLLGRKIELSDLALDNMLKLVGFNKYTIYKAKREGLEAAFQSMIIPPFALFSLTDDLWRDLKKKDKPDVGDMRIWNGLPVVGKFYYWWFGGGKKSMKNKKKKSRSAF